MSETYEIGLQNAQKQLLKHAGTALEILQIRFHDKPKDFSLYYKGRMEMCQKRERSCIRRGRRMCGKYDGVWPKDEGSLVEREVGFYQKRKETQLKEGRGCGKGCPQRDWKAVTSYLPIQTSGFNLAVSLRSWKWRTQLPSPSSFTVPRISRALTFCPLATMTEERLQ